MVVINQGQDIRNFMDNEFKKTEKKLEEIKYDIKEVSSNISRGTSLMTSNLNAFRFENFNQLVEKMVRHDIYLSNEQQ